KTGATNRTAGREEQMTSLLNRLTDKKLSERTTRFNSPGMIGRLKPRLVLVGPLAAAVGDARPGAKISLRVYGVLTGRETATRSDGGNYQNQRFSLKK